uniref:indole-3-pyruvate monooxygenase n=1 Tax=Ananas comosus var. bracteatus TaxID=296719 RepID=A0A6V7Q3M4_ANACO|nr:unnamed protein product [Ananas comosus var. bracteatus]
MTSKETSTTKRLWWVPGPLIIGAGPSGLATAACLKDRGVPYLVLEKDCCIAASWKLRTYERLKLHLPKHFCELPLMPFPQHFPTYPTKQQFISYLECYAKRFAVEPLFGARVDRAERDASLGLWRVRAGESEFISRWLVVATGECGGGFGCGLWELWDGVSLDLCNNGAHPSMVVRDKLHVLPRETFGISTFGLSVWLLKWLPMRYAKGWAPAAQEHNWKTPVLDVGTLAKIKSGHIKVLYSVPNINRFTDKGVEFVDGRKEEFNSVILATGYKSNVPSWLKDEEFFNKNDGSRRRDSRTVGKARMGLCHRFHAKRLMGASIDARKIAEDIATQWNSKPKHLPCELL